MCCRMLQGEHSALLSTFIKLRHVIKIFVLSIWEWPLKTGFIVFFVQRLQKNKRRQVTFPKTTPTLTLCVLVSSADLHTVWMQIRPDTLMVFLQEHKNTFNKDDFEKKNQQTTKRMQNCPACKKLNRLIHRQLDCKSWILGIVGD